MTTVEKLQRAWQHHEARQFAPAEALYREVLQQEPNNPSALHLLGLLAQEVGNLPAAAELIARATRLAPQVAEFKFHLAIVLEQLNRPADAAAVYQATLRINPNLGEAQNNLGHLLLGLGRPQEAFEACQRAVALLPNIPEPHNNLANALRHLRRPAEAIAAYHNVLRLNPNFGTAWLNLGHALIETQRLGEAAEALQRAAQLEPDPENALHSLGIVLMRLGRLKEAEDAFMEVIVRSPQAPEPRNNLGNVLTQQGRLKDAIEAFEVAIRLKRGDSVTLNNLANALLTDGQSDRAIEMYRAAIASNPNDGSIYTNLGGALKDQGRQEEAAEAYRQAVRLAPDVPAVRSNLLYGLQLLPHVDPQTMFEEHLQYGRAFAPPTATHQNDRNPGRRLRIGFVSGDLHNHPVGRFMLPILEHHDRGQFEIVCFSDATGDDDIAQRLRQHANQWHNILGRSHGDVAELIRAQKIDILFDLAGHTAHNRLPVFAQKPAPLQVSCLGYPNTTGLASIDYRMTDALADPPGAADAFYTEKLLRLPGCAWCFDATDAPDVAPPPAAQAGYITFGSFNNFAKVNAAVLDLWARVLTAVPNARLLIKAFSLHDAAVRQRVRDTFAQRGVDAERVELLGSTRDHREHLALYGKVDIALDTFPYHGTTTTCEALWMGVPVITQAGQTHASRVGVSLLSAIGHCDWIATDAEQYVQLAKKMAGDRDALAHVRSTLRERVKTSPLGEVKRFTNSFESALRSIWRHWANGA
jgi:predicted O-linked N-acetylglucosamine transferase (SPINDLY family)